MELQKNKEFGTCKTANLTKKDLQEGQVYSLPFLSKNGTVLVNQCLYAVIDGQIVIHRSANWEDIPVSNLSKESFLLEQDKTVASLPDSLLCFVSLDKLVLI